MFLEDSRNRKVSLNIEAVVNNFGAFSLSYAKNRAIQKLLKWKANTLDAWILYPIRGPCDSFGTTWDGLWTSLAFLWSPSLPKGHSVQTGSMGSLNSIGDPSDSFGIYCDVPRNSLACSGTFAAYGTPCATESQDEEPLADIYILNSLSTICLNKRNWAIILSLTSKPEFLSVPVQQRNSLVSSDIQGALIFRPILSLRNIQYKTLTEYNHTSCIGRCVTLMDMKA